MIVLGVHPGMHDASAALLDDYHVLGAVQMERLNRAKGSGIEREAWAWPCVDELLAMQGLRSPGHRLRQREISPARFEFTRR